MTKTLKYLVYLEIAFIALAVLLYLITRNADDFSGLVVFYPLLGMIINGVVILVLAFTNSAIKSTVGSPSKSWLGLIPIVTALIGVPILGIHYASIGINRGGLALVSKAALILGVIFSFVAISRSLKIKK